MKIEYWNIVFKSEWVVGLAGSLILMGMLIPFNILDSSSPIEKLTLGMLMGIIATMIAFGMSLKQLRKKQ